MRVDGPTNARSRRTRAALLGATRELLEERGFEELTMEAVAERAGVSRRAVYLHFTSRGELVAALFDFITESEGLAASTRPVWDAPDAGAALDEWARHVAHFQPDVLAVTLAFERMRRRDPDAAAHRRRYLREQLQACRRLARRLEDEGRLAPLWTVDTAGEMLFGLVSTDLLERLLTERRWSRDKLARHLARLLRSTFDARAGDDAGDGRSRPVA